LLGEVHRETAATRDCKNIVALVFVKLGRCASVRQAVMREFGVDAKGISERKAEWNSARREFQILM
jgi:hypothetical protein